MKRGKCGGAAENTCMPKGHKKVLLSDVARRARVSLATVSRAMTGQTTVGAEARARIFRAAEELGFDLGGTRRSRIIAFLLSNRAVLHPFHSAVLVGAEAYCAEHDYALLFLPFAYPLHDKTEDLAVPEILLRRRTVSGVIVAGTNSPALLAALDRREVPWVALGNNLVEERGAAAEAPPRDGAVYFDDVGGAFQLTRHLQSLGHRRIGFAGNIHWPWYARRRRGYERAMREAGMEPLSGDLNSREGEEMGYLAAKMMFAGTAAPSAIFAGDDSAARGVYLAARDSGLVIPEDLAVAGFNDSLEATSLHPALTTVRVFMDEVGKQMAEMLLRRIARPGEPAGSLTLPTQLIQRASCLPPPGAATASRPA